MKTIFTSILSLTLLITANSATTNFTDAIGDGLWSTPGNWTNGVPGVGDDVIINQRRSVLIDVAPNTLASLSLVGPTSGSPVFTSLTIGDGFNLTITGDMTINGGTSNSRVSYVTVGDGTSNGGVPPYTASSLTVQGNLVFNAATNGRAVLDLTGTNGDGVFSLYVGGNITTGGSARGTIVAVNTLSGYCNTRLNGAGTQTIDIGDGTVGNSIAYGNIIVENTGTVVFNSATGNNISTTSLGGDVTINLGGTLNNNAFTIVGNTKNLTINGTYIMTGTTTMPTGFTTSLGSSSTVDYAGTAQTVSTNPTYHNLTISGSGTKSVGAGLDVNGTLTISAGTLDLGGFQLNLAGNLVNNATLTTGSNTIVFDGTTTISGSSSNSFNNVTVNAANALTFGSTATSIAGTVTLGNGSAVNLGTNTITMSASSATWTDNGATVTPSTSTQSFTGNGSHTISSGSQFGTLTFSGTIVAPALLKVAGDFNNNGTFTYGTGTVEFNGTGTQAIGGSAGTLTFYNMGATTNAHTVNMANDADLINRLDVTGGATFDADGTGNNRVFTLKSSGQQYAPVGTTAMIGDLSNGTVTGNLTMERHINGYTGWRQLACPIQSQTIANWDDELITTGFTGSDFPGETFVSVQQYDPATTAFTVATNTTNAISSDGVTDFKGFNVYVGNTSPGTVMSPAITLLNTGTVVSGNKSVTVSGSGDGYNLIQNPFPSAIDFDNLLRTNVDNQFFIFDNYTGNYDDWDGATSTGGHIVNGIIANGQAFWVHATSAGSVGIDENDKISTGTDASFLKTVATSSYEFIRMKATTAATPFSDAMIVGLSGDFSDNYIVGEDADKFTSPYPAAPTLSSLAGNIDVAKNKMAINSTMAIPVRLKVGISGTYTLTADEITIQGACITLEDKVTNTFTDLRTSAYTFTINDTTTAPRFVLHINNVIANVVTSALNASCINSNDGLLVASPNGTSGNATFNYTWKDKNNTVLKTTVNKAGADSLANLPAGDYTVTISQYGSTCGSDYTVALQISQPSAVNAIFTADNTIVDKGVAVNFTNNSSNAANYVWNFGDGSAVDNNPNPSHTYTAVGNYTVTLTASDGCGTLNSTTTVIIVNSPLGINTLVANGPINITIYNNVITTVFDFNQTNNTTIEVFDILGNLIVSKFVEISKGTDQITLPEVSSGIYLVKVSSAEKIVTKKLYLHK